MGMLGPRNSYFVILCIVLIALQAHVKYVNAETLYVSDTLIITLREEQRDTSKIIKYLKTGTPLEITEKDNDYFKVRTQDGEEGWVRKKYLTSEIPKTSVIAGLKKEVKRLNVKIDEIKKERNALNETLRSSKKSFVSKEKELNKAIKNHKEETAQTARELKQMTEKYNTLVEDSMNVVELVSERDRLQLENERLKKEEEYLRRENARLMRTGMLWWFLAGAGVFFVGWIAGKFSRRKKKYY